MKKDLLKFILIGALTALVTSNFLAQAPNWQWALGAGGAGTDEIGYGIATDASGNVYSTGSFVTGTLTIGTSSVTRFGGGNVYVSKQDANGNVLWLKKFGGASSFFGGGTGRSVCTDASGNVYITGMYLTSLVVGTTTLNATDSTASNVGDIFIVKLDASGNVVWAKSAGGAYGDGAYSIAVDNSNNVFITGYFKSRYLRFGSLTVFSANNNSSSMFLWQDIFVAKYDASGNPVWASGAGTSGVDEGKGICVDAAGNVLLAGTFNMGTVTIGSNSVAGTSATNMIVAKYDNSGNSLWAKTATGSGSGAINHSASAITTDAGNNVYITGGFIASTLTIGSNSVVRKGSNDVLVAKFDPSGNNQWIRNAWAGAATGTGIIKDGNNDIFVAGYFDGVKCVFGTDSIMNKNTGGSNEDVFVAKYSSSGSLSWVTGAGGNFRDIPNGISVDASGNAYVTGQTLNTSLTFGTLSVTCTGGYADIIIAKIGNLTGIKENEMDHFISLYPNPSHGAFFIKNHSELVLDRIIVTDMTGRMILQKEMDGQIDLNGFPKGIYFCHISCGKQNVVRKLVVQ